MCQRHEETCAWPSPGEQPGGVLALDSFPGLETPATKVVRDMKGNVGTFYRALVVAAAVLVGIPRRTSSGSLKDP